MKTKEMKKLALLGITAGLISMGGSEVQALDAEAISLDIEHMIAKPKCEAHGGCAGLTASRDVKRPAADDAELNDEEKSEDEYDDHLDNLPN